TLRGAGRGNHSLGKAQDDREPFARRQRTRELPACVTGLDDLGPIVLSLRALIARVAFGAQLVDLDRCWQQDVDRAAIDRKRPTRADRIPVQLVMVVEEAELARRPI